MPVRKIPKNYLCVTGSFASRKNGQMGGFESLLEKEYMLLLDFDDSVERFEEQPVTVPVPGVVKGYTPDVIVHFRADPATGQTRPPLLTEIKHSDDIKKNAEKYAAKFAAAKQYAIERGWEFGLTTEKDIRTPRLANIKFLREYRNIAPAEEDCARVIRLMGDADGTSSVQNLLEQLAATDDDQLYWLPVIWNLVLQRQLVTNLDVSMGDNISLHLPEGSP
ncbi:MAG: heteromeric transposase endonuclease subunit TnsA [Glaciimonas sp.]|nr:heteromeric transposase endonuclease subunit TnsA [Glaciimonas sp.]